MLLASLILLLATGPILWLIRPHRLGYAGWLAALPPAAVFAWLLTQIPAISQGLIPSEQYPWNPSLGLELSLRLDGLALLFGLIITGVGAAIALYTHYYLDQERHQGLFYAYLFLFMTSMLGLVWADNLLLLFVFWEGTSISSYLLIGFENRSAQARAGARNALIVTSFGGIFMLAGFVLLGSQIGVYSLSQLLAQPSLLVGISTTPILILIFLGAFTKSAQFPFHFWLPGAMSAPTPASAYLHSATMVKAGIYLLARLHPLFSTEPIWFWTLLWVGGLTMLIGAVLAVGKWDIKALLAYATISQLGILVFLLAFTDKMAYTAVVVGILAHALYKGPLFMVAGIVDHATHTRDIRRLANLWRKLPVTSVVALLAGLSMAGLPPLFGFLAKESLLETLFHHLEVKHTWIWWGPIALTVVVGAFFVAYSLTLIWEAFLRPRAAAVEQAEVEHGPPLAMVAGPLALVVLGTILPFLTGSLLPTLLDPAASAVGGESMHIHLALWAGITPTLIASLTAIGLGVLLFVARDLIRRILHLLPEWSDGANLFRQILVAIDGLALGTTRLLQGRTLAAHAAITLGASLAIFFYALLWYTGDLTLEGLRLGEAGIWRLSEMITAGVAATAAVVTVRAISRMNAIISLGVVGVVVMLYFVFFGAPDLALTELIVDILAVVLLVLVFYRIPAHTLPPLSQFEQVRNWIVATAMGVFGVLLVLVTAGRPFFTSISEEMVRQSVSGGHGANVVNVILVDFRGFDTLGEITVLTIAGLGVYALLRSHRLRIQQVGRRPTNQLNPALESKDAALGLPVVPGPSSGLMGELERPRTG